MDNATPTPAPAPAPAPATIWSNPNFKLIAGLVLAVVLSVLAQKGITPTPIPVPVAPTPAPSATPTVLVIHTGTTPPATYSPTAFGQK